MSRRVEGRRRARCEREVRHLVVGVWAAAAVLFLLTDRELVSCRRNGCTQSQLRDSGTPPCPGVVVVVLVVNVVDSCDLPTCKYLP